MYRPGSFFRGPGGAPRIPNSGRKRPPGAPLRGPRGRPPHTLSGGHPPVAPRVHRRLCCVLATAMPVRPRGDPDRTGFLGAAVIVGFFAAVEGPGAVATRGRPLEADSCAPDGTVCRVGIVSDPRGRITGPRAHRHLQPPRRSHREFPSQPTRHQEHQGARDVRSMCDGPCFAPSR